MSLKDSKILVIVGKAGAGKDTLAQYLREYIFGTDPNPAVYNFKFSEPLKEACAGLFGWDKYRLNELDYKEDSIRSHNITRLDGSLLKTRREVLQYVGTDVFRQMKDDVWVEAALRRADHAVQFETPEMIVSTDCRFANEQDALYKAFDRALFVKLFRTGAEWAPPHPSEDIGGLETAFEFTVKDGDLDQLRFIARILGDYFYPELPKDGDDE